MNRILQSILSVLFPFYPIWVGIIYFITKKNINEYINLLLLPIVIYVLIYKTGKIPKYLFFLILFTIYHLWSIYYYNLVPVEGGWSLVIRSDSNIFACAILFIIENTKFDDKFIFKMNRNILLVVFLSCVVSLVQMKSPFFFFNMQREDGIEYVGEGRIFSIYSWTDLNSLGITFPVLVGLLLGIIDTKKVTYFFVVISGIVVAFLSRSRYVMISTIIVLSQLLILKTISLKKKLYFIIIFFVSVVLLVNVAENFGFDIQKVIEERILEKDNDTKMASAKARVTSYEVFLEIFPEHPWFGVGPKTREDVVDLLGGEAPIIHVGFLSYLYYYGAIGCLFFFLSLFFLLQRGWRIGRKFAFWGSFFGIVTFCFANLTLVYFNISEMGIIIALIYLKYYSQNKSETNFAVLGA